MSDKKMREKELAVCTRIVKGIKETSVCSRDFKEGSPEQNSYMQKLNKITKTGEALTLSGKITDAQYPLFPTFFGVGECMSLAHLVFFKLLMSNEVDSKRIHMLTFADTSSRDTTGHCFGVVGNIDKIDIGPVVPCFSSPAALKKFFVDHINGLIVDSFFNFVATPDKLPLEFLNYFIANTLSSLFSIHSGTSDLIPKARILYEQTEAIARTIDPDKSDYLKTSSLPKPQDIKKQRMPTDKKTQQAKVDNSSGIKALKEGESEKAAERFEKAGEKFNEAERLFRSVLDYWKSHLTAFNQQQATHFNLGNALLQGKKYQEALDHLTAAFNLQDKPGTTRAEKYKQRMEQCAELMKMAAIEDNLKSLTITQPTLHSS